MSIPAVLPKVIPSGVEVTREALIVIGGAILAAVILSQLPALQKFIRDRVPSAN